MRNQRAIDQFTLAFHQRAVVRLRGNSELLGKARETLGRWSIQRGATASDTYFEQWRNLLDTGIDALEQAVCADTDTAAALRSVSPLGFVLSPEERMALHRLPEV